MLIVNTTLVTGQVGSPPPPPPAPPAVHAAGGQEETGPLTPDSGYGDGETRSDVRTEQNKIKKSTSLQFPRYGGGGGQTIKYLIV